MNPPTSPSPTLSSQGYCQQLHQKMKTFMPSVDSSTLERVNDIRTMLKLCPVLVCIGACPFSLKPESMQRNQRNACRKCSSNQAPGPRVHVCDHIHQVWCPLADQSHCLSLLRCFTSHQQLWMWLRNKANTLSKPTLCSWVCRGIYIIDVD